MIRSTRWLAVLAVCVLAGCNQSQSGSGTSQSSTTSGSSSTTTESSSGTSAGATTTTESSAPATSTAQEKTMENGLKYVDMVVGTGATAADGMTVTVHYTGWLTNGTKFDSSVDRNEPFSFVLGKGAVIRGWDEGVKGMQVGGKRKLTIPSDLAYGAQGAGGGLIPPNSTLVFDVELLGVK